MYSDCKLLNCIYDNIPWLCSVIIVERTLWFIPCREHLVCVVASRTCCFVIPFAVNGCTAHKPPDVGDNQSSLVLDPVKITKLHIISY